MRVLVIRPVYFVDFIYYIVLKNNNHTTLILHYCESHFRILTTALQKKVTTALKTLFYF